MSNREFWEEEPELLWAYRKFYTNKLKLDRDMYNFQAWLQGVYNFDALSVALHNSFAGKNQATKEYMSKPIDFYEVNKSDEERKIDKQKLLEAKLTSQFNKVKCNKGLQ